MNGKAIIIYLMIKARHLVGILILIIFAEDKGGCAGPWFVFIIYGFGFAAACLRRELKGNHVRIMDSPAAVTLVIGNPTLCHWFFREGRIVEVWSYFQHERSQKTCQDFVFP